jgi:hypothetical protein
MNGLDFSLLVVSCISAFGCAPKQPSPSLAPHADTVAIRVSLKAAMGRSNPAFAKAIAEREAAAIRLRSEPSSAFSGITYYWGTLVPVPDELHVVTAVLAVYEDRSIVLESASDFERLLNHVSRAKRIDAPPAKVCEEAIRTTGERRHALWQPTMFTRELNVTGLHLVGGPLPPGRINPPHYTSRESSTTVEAWFFEVGRTALYECSYDGTAGTVRFQVRDSVLYRGFPGPDY